MPKINEIYKEIIIMTTDIFKEWTLKKIEENPKLFGGDNGNPAIIQEYLSELHGDTPVSNVPREAFSQSVAVSRVKNHLLLEYPRYDYRVKYKPKTKRQSEDDEVA